MKPFIDLSHIYNDILLDMDVSQEEINHELLSYVASHMNEIQKDPDEKQASWIDKIPYRETPPQNIKIPNKKEYDLWSKQKRNWYTFFNGAEYMWDYVLYLTDHESYVGREKPAGYKKQVIEQCPLLFKFINRLPLRIYGRIVFLGVNPRQKVYKHRDDLIDDNLPECILMNFSNNQKTLKMGWKKIKVRCITFDERLPHELNGGNRFTYTLRIDGKWNDSLRKYINKQ